VAALAVRVAVVAAAAAADPADFRFRLIARADCICPRLLFRRQASLWAPSSPHATVMGWGMTSQPSAGRTANALAAVVLTFVLGACQTLGTGAIIEDEEVMRAASPTNLASLSDVVQRNPNDPQAYNMRGSVYGRAQRFNDALNDFNQAIKIDPKYAQAYVTRGMIQRAQGQPQQALGDFNKAIQLSQNNAQAFHNRGLVYQEQGLHKFAIDDFTTAVGLSVNAAEPFHARGLSYLAIGEHKRAAEDFDDALTRDDRSVEIWTSRGLAYERLGNKQQAAGSYARALNINQSYQPATAGFRRVGGQYGASYNLN
jgi:tetratricopeptide (TPR) repeat protein